jgi:hypothetical protein
MFSRLTALVRAGFAALLTAVLCIGAANGGAHATPALPAVAAANAQPQAPAQVPARGHGLVIRGEWFGYYVDNGKKIWCLAPGLKLTQGRFHLTKNLPFVVVGNKTFVVGATKSRWIAFVLSQWGNTPSNNVAAATRMALLEIVGDVPPGINTSARTQIGGMAASEVRQAKAYYGPDKLGLAVRTRVLVGQTGMATVTAKAASRHGAPGITVQLAGANATVPKIVKTSGTGQATFTYTRTGTGPVKLTARAASLPPDTMLASLPRPGEQLLVSGTAPTSASASATYQAIPGSPAISYSCDSACDGHPPVTVKFCQPAGVAPASDIVFDNAHAVSSVSFGRSAMATCKSVTVIVADTHVVTFGVRYSVSGKLSGVVPLPGRIIIDCPPWPAVSESVKCNCTNGTLTLTLQNNGRTKEQLIWSVNGGRNQTKLVAPSSPVSVNVPFSRTAGTTVVYTGGVQRLNGQWIIPPSLEAVIPKAA